MTRGNTNSRNNLLRKVIKECEGDLTQLSKENIIKVIDSKPSLEILTNLLSNSRVTQKLSKNSLIKAITNIIDTDGTFSIIQSFKKILSENPDCMKNMPQDPMSKLGNKIMCHSEIGDYTCHDALMEQKDIVKLMPIETLRSLKKFLGFFDMKRHKDIRLAIQEIQTAEGTHPASIASLETKDTYYTQQEVVQKTAPAYMQAQKDTPQTKSKKAYFWSQKALSLVTVENPFPSQEAVSTAIGEAFEYFKEGYDEQIDNIVKEVKEANGLLIAEHKKKKENYDKEKYKYDQYQDQKEYFENIPALIQHAAITQEDQEHPSASLAIQRQELLEIEKRMSDQFSRPVQTEAYFQARRFVGQRVSTVSRATAEALVTNLTDNTWLGGAAGAVVGEIVPNSDPKYWDQKSIGEREERILKASDKGRKEFLKNAVSTISLPDEVSETPPLEGSVADRVNKELAHPCERFHNILDRLTPEQVKRMNPTELDVMLIAGFEAIGKDVPQGVHIPTLSKGYSFFQKLFEKAPEEMFQGEGAFTGERLSTCLEFIEEALASNTGTTSDIAGKVIKSPHNAYIVNQASNLLKNIFSKVDKNIFNADTPDATAQRGLLQKITHHSIAIASTAHENNLVATRPLEALLQAVGKNIVQEPSPAGNTQLSDAPITLGTRPDTPSENIPYPLPIERTLNEALRRAQKGNFSVLSSLIDIAERSDNTNGTTSGKEIFDGHDKEFMQSAVDAALHGNIKDAPIAVMTVARLLSLYNKEDFASNSAFGNDLVQKIILIADRHQNDGFFDHMSDDCAFKRVFDKSAGSRENMQNVFNDNSNTSSILPSWRSQAEAGLMTSKCEERNPATQQHATRALNKPSQLRITRDIMRKTRPYVPSPALGRGHATANMHI